MLHGWPGRGHWRLGAMYCGFVGQVARGTLGPADWQSAFRVWTRRCQSEKNAPVLMRFDPILIAPSGMHEQAERCETEPDSCRLGNSRCE